MSRLPRGRSGQEVIRALEKAGFEVSRQKGSHVVLYRIDPKSRVVVPLHDEVRVGTLSRILVEAGLSADEFVELLRD